MLVKIPTIIITASIIPMILCFNAFANEQDSREWKPISTGPITTWTAPLCGKGKFVIQPFFFYNRTRGTFNNDGHYDSLPGDDRKYQFQQQLFMQYGLTDKLEIDAQTVYQENHVRRNDRKSHSEGFGDSYLFMRYCALEDKSWFPHTSGLLQVKFPSGKYQKADPDKLGTDLMGATSGGGSYDFGLGLNLSKKIKPFVVHADAIYSFPQEVKVDSVNTEYGKYLNYDFGLEYFLTDNFNLLLEANGFLQPDKKNNGDKIPASDISYLTIATGIGWSNSKIQTLLAYQRVLSGTNIDANDSIVLTLVYAF